MAASGRGPLHTDPGAAGMKDMGRASAAVKAKLR